MHMQSGECTAAAVRRQSILGNRLQELRYRTVKIDFLRLLDDPLGGLVMPIAEEADPAQKRLISDIR